MIYYKKKILDINNNWS